MTQHLLYITFQVKKPGMFTCRAQPVKLPWRTKDIQRIWTLYQYTDKDTPPTLPYRPVHLQNAFLEDYIHDWNVWHGELFYASRITDEPVWILVELKEG